MINCEVRWTWWNLQDRLGEMFKVDLVKSCSLLIRLAKTCLLWWEAVVELFRWPRRGSHPGDNPSSNGSCMTDSSITKPDWCWQAQDFVHTMWQIFLSLSNKIISFYIFPRLKAWGIWSQGCTSVTVCRLSVDVFCSLPLRYCLTSLNVFLGSSNGWLWHCSTCLDVRLHLNLVSDHWPYPILFKL